MQKVLNNLINKKFSVRVGNEFERYTDFLGLIDLLYNFSDFKYFSKEEKINWLNGHQSIIKGKTLIYIDSNISVVYTN